MFTRDSLLWVLVIFGSILAYLSQAPPPWEWDWPQWVQALSALVGILAGYLQSSPLKGKPKGDQVKPSRFLGVLLVLLLLPGMIGCGLTSKPNLPNVPPAPLSTLATFAQRVEQAGKIAEQAQQLEIGMHRLGYVPRETHVAIQQGLLALSVSVQAGLDLAATTLNEQSARDALAAIAKALERVEADAQAVTHDTVRSVLHTMARTIRIVLGLLPAATTPDAAVAEWQVMYHGLAAGL